MLKYQKIELHWCCDLLTTYYNAIDYIYHIKEDYNVFSVLYSSIMSIWRNQIDSSIEIKMSIYSKTDHIPLIVSHVVRSKYITTFYFTCYLVCYLQWMIIGILNVVWYKMSHKTGKSKWSAFFKAISEMSINMEWLAPRRKYDLLWLLFGII